MNDDLEHRLRAMQPADPPQELIRRLIDAEPPAPGKITPMRIAVPFGIAAAVALFFALHRPSSPLPRVAAAPQPSDFRVFLPVGRTSTLVDLRDVAVIDTALPIRLVSATWLDDTTYAGDDGNSTMRRREPRTEIIPVSLEVF